MSVTAPFERTKNLPGGERLLGPSVGEARSIESGAVDSEFSGENQRSDG